MKIDKARASGLHVAGFLSYELAYMLEPKLRHLIHNNRQSPLIWMGLFHEPQRLKSDETLKFINALAADNHSVEQLRLSLAKETYLQAVQRVKAYISAGDVYQINLTFKYLFELVGSSWSLYESLRQRQQVAHGAFIQTHDFDVLSFSPELFIHVTDGVATTRPMKGTAARGLTTTEDDELRHWLVKDEKSRAENLMIVDLLRNDLGRIAEIGTVSIENLFSVETYPTLHQMTSTVMAHLDGEISASKLINNLFPCGSITGAPKVRAIEIIRELETEPRGIYTGSIGMFDPNGDIKFNVAIRTLVIDRMGHGEMGIGSGIVYDSDSSAEYEECLLKARFLTEPKNTYSLIETLRWQADGGYYLLENHLERLENSALHFGIAYNASRVLSALEELVTEFVNSAVRVRLLLDQTGKLTLTHVPLSGPKLSNHLTYVFSTKTINSRDLYRYHKTTNRKLLDAEYKKLTETIGCDEVLFLNEKGEITEGSRSNLFVKLDECLVTPPTTCGLLNGTFRRSLFDAPNCNIIEQVLLPSDLERAQCIYLGNSIMGLIAAHAHPSIKK